MSPISRTRPQKMENYSDLREEHNSAVAYDIRSEYSVNVKVEQQAGSDPYLEETELDEFDAFRLWKLRRFIKKGYPHWDIEGNMLKAERILATVIDLVDNEENNEEFIKRVEVLNTKMRVLIDSAEAYLRRTGQQYCVSSYYY